ncbi:MAG: hypothetical protein ACE5JQ_15850 [Candidatus Methylomirabilales bacterium]
MALIDIGGQMPDGSWAQEFLIEESDFVCASGATLSQSPVKPLLGKLCLTTTSLVFLPYEGALLYVVQQLAAHLRKTVLGPYEDVAAALDTLGLYPGPEVVGEVLFWPLDSLSGPARVRERSFLGIRGGADLIISVEPKGEVYEFNMATEGRQPEGFASAQTFMKNINRLLDEEDEDYEEDDDSEDEDEGDKENEHEEDEDEEYDEE